MKKLIFNLSILSVVFITFAFTTATGSKLISKSGHINFYSHTAVEDISADNFKAISTLDTSTGDLVYSIPMQSFEFKKTLMQKHYNSPKFLNTKKFPKSKFKGQITNLDAVSFDKNGAYTASVKGEMTIHGVTKEITEDATITVEGSKIIVVAKFSLTLADYGIAFKKGKPSTNIAKTIEVTSKTIYNKE